MPRLLSGIGLIGYRILAYGKKQKLVVRTAATKTEKWFDLREPNDYTVKPGIVSGLSLELFCTSGSDPAQKAQSATLPHKIG
jgi:hypothetical protein